MRRQSFLTCAAVLLSWASLVICSSCNGNGELDHFGEIYGPSSRSSQGSSADGDFSYSAGDILGYSNAGDTDAIIDLLSGGQVGTTTVSLSSSQIGLPAGGYVTLAITGGGVSFVADGYASSDGNVYFQIPQMVTGSTVTVSIIVRQADGTVVCSGSKTQVVDPSSNLFDISLTGSSGGVWTLPNPPTVSATPTSVDYKHSVTPVPTVTLSVVGLADPPEGSLSYAWTNAQGAAIGTDSSSITVPVTDIIGVDPTTLPAGNSTLSVGLALTYTDADGNTQTVNAACPVAVTIYEIPSFTLEVDTTLPAGVTAHSGSGYDVADTSQKLTVRAVSSSGFRPGTTFVWTLNGTTMSDTISSASIPLSSLTSLSTTTPTTLTVTCQAVDSWAINSPSPATPVSTTLDFYKPTLPTPVATCTCDGSSISASGGTFEFYAVDDTNLAMTNLTFDLDSATPAMPSGTVYVWKINGSYMWGTTGSTTSSQGTNLGAISGVTGLPATITAVCEVSCDGYESVESDPITIKVNKKALPIFYVSINGYPGQNAPTGGSTYYHVAADSKIDVRLMKAAYETGTIPANGSGASFAWKAGGFPVGDPGSTQEASLLISDVLSAMGINYSSIPVWDGTGAQPSGGVEIRISCTISFGGATKNSSSDSAYETYNVVTIYR